MTVRNRGDEQPRGAIERDRCGSVCVMCVCVWCAVCVCVLSRGEGVQQREHTYTRALLLLLLDGHSPNTSHMPT